MATEARSDDQWWSSPRYTGDERRSVLSSSAPPGQQALILGPIAMALVGGLVGFFLLLMGTVGAVGVVAILAGISLILIGASMRSS